MENKKPSAATPQINCDCEVIHDEVVSRVRGSMYKEDSFFRLSNLYKMFADNTRVKIL